MGAAVWIGAVSGYLVGTYFAPDRPFDAEGITTGVAGAAVGGLIGFLIEGRLQPARPGPTTPPVARCPPEGTRVLLIGDSYSVGFGPELQKLAAACGTPYHHHGEVGSSVTQWDRDSWLNPQLDAADPNVVLLSLGGNDFGRNDPARVEAAISDLLGRIRDRGARPIWISPPTTPFADKIGVRDMWKRAMGNDAFDSTALDIPRVPTDPLGHPTGAGYKLWASALWPWLSGHLTYT